MVSEAACLPLYLIDTKLRPGARRDFDWKPMVDMSVAKEAARRGIVHGGNFVSGPFFAACHDKAMKRAVKNTVRRGP